MQQVGKLERFQNTQKTLIYRSKKAQGAVNAYTPVHEEFELDKVFEVRGLSRQREEGRRVHVNQSVRPDRRTPVNRVLRVRDSTHPRLYIRKGAMNHKESDG